MTITQITITITIPTLTIRTTTRMTIRKTVTKIPRSVNYDNGNDSFAAITTITTMTISQAPHMP